MSYSRITFWRNAIFWIRRCIIIIVIIIILINNNNSNSSNNNNNKNLFASSIFTMALPAIEKTIKMNKNVKIYQYITVNTKNMTTKTVKGLKTDSDSKMKVYFVIHSFCVALTMAKLRHAFYFHIWCSADSDPAWRNSIKTVTYMNTKKRPFIKL